jgi:hypothetical protein
METAAMHLRRSPRLSGSSTHLPRPTGQHRIRVRRKSAPLSCGSAFALLRDVPAALEATARALDLYAPGDYADWALSRLDRAQCLAWTDPDTGLGYAAETIAALTGPQRRGIIADRARGLLGALSPAQLTSPLAREFADLVEA